jgi:hypothetical protein
MFLTYWADVFFILLLAVTDFLAIGGWVYESAKREKSEKKVNKLEYDNRKLREALRRNTQRSNIDVANDYNKELNKDEGHS